MQVTESNVPSEEGFVLLREINRKSHKKIDEDDMAVVQSDTQ